MSQGLCECCSLSAHSFLLIRSTNSSSSFRTQLLSAPLGSLPWAPAFPPSSGSASGSLRGPEACSPPLCPGQAAWGAYGKQEPTCLLPFLLQTPPPAGGLEFPFQEHTPPLRARQARGRAGWLETGGGRRWSAESGWVRRTAGTVTGAPGCMRSHPTGVWAAWGPCSGGTRLSF